MTLFEKHIYNNYLIATRTSKNLPFKLRKNFDKLDDKNFVLIKKIASFLRRFPHIKTEEFFKAPYVVYSDQDYFPLEYFTTLKATKAYTLFQNKKLSMDPDSDEQLNNIKQSLVYIFNFCQKNQINPKNYINHKTNNQFSFMIHLKEHKVNVFSLLGFENFEKNLKLVESDVAKFIVGDDLFNNISVFRTKLYSSKKAVKLVELGIKKIINKFA